ncbi:hypothetical protein PsorP6_011718 [Peronosclerospora sorghi]|uniref:Uncharacterized protein n=1 Tax=Peronosclerospora sorghi TaxID=230839 RepID=A0ACC0WIY3_9STRA|nr:hypothetical protein PsorP6_011718 [Peronosclerospora sorghi]
MFGHICMFGHTMLETVENRGTHMLLSFPTMSPHTTNTSPKSFETTAPAARLAIELVLQSFADRESFELLSVAR